MGSRERRVELCEKHAGCGGDRSVPFDSVDDTASFNLLHQPTRHQEPNDWLAEWSSSHLAP